MSQKNDRKVFVVDTSVLLYDKNCFDNFQGNDIILPLIVLEELDKFKTREGILGENARYINRLLDNYREFGSLHDGVCIEEKNITVKVELNQKWENIQSLDKNDNDNLIISTINYIKDFYKSHLITLITKDINLRVKADSLGIQANDYYADYEFIETDNLFKGFNEFQVDKTIIDNVYSQKSMSSRKIENADFLSENEFLILKNESHSALCIKKFNELCLVRNKQEFKNKFNIEPKNKEQTFAMEALTDDKIPLVTLTGVPGSGKTYLTLMTALKLIEAENKKRIIFTRPIQTVGKDIGFLPGTLNEKMAPWLAPIVDNFRNQFGDLTYFDLMMEKGIIDIAPLSYIRGRSFNDAIIIVDEAQNATVHELKTVITRTGKNSKIVLLGDIEQVDLPYINKFSNGLTIVVEKMKKSNLTAHVCFTKGYRSELANAASEML